MKPGNRIRLLHMTHEALRCLVTHANTSRFMLAATFLTGLAAVAALTRAPVAEADERDFPDSQLEYFHDLYKTCARIELGNDATRAAEADRLAAKRELAEKFQGKAQVEGWRCYITPNGCEMRSRQSQCLGIQDCSFELWPTKLWLEYANPKSVEKLYVGDLIEFDAIRQPSYCAEQRFRAVYNVRVVRKEIFSRDDWMDLGDERP